MYTTDSKTRDSREQLYSSLLCFKSYFFPRSFTPRALSSFPIICWLGMAFPDSYSWIIWGFSLITCKREKKFKASPELKFKVSLDVREWESERVRERGTCASWAWVSFLSILACIIAFFSSVGTRSSVGDQNVLESFSSNGKHHTTSNKKKSNLGKK